MPHNPAQYRLGAFDEAAASYEAAASLAQTASMRSRSWYNLGNCMVKTGDALRQTDPQAAGIGADLAVGGHQDLVVIEAVPRLRGEAWVRIFDRALHGRAGRHAGNDQRKSDLSPRSGSPGGASRWGPAYCGFDRTGGARFALAAPGLDF